LEKKIIGLRLLTNIGLKDTEEDLNKLMCDIENDIVDLLEKEHDLVVLGGKCEFIYEDDKEIRLSTN
jgi:phosphosulfolactate synthase (CoM biosynthesis protein A)